MRLVNVEWLGAFSAGFGRLLDYECLRAYEGVFMKRYDIQGLPLMIPSDSTEVLEWDVRRCLQDTLVGEHHLYKQRTALITHDIDYSE